MIVAHFVGGSRDGERRAFAHFRPVVDFEKLGPFPSIGPGRAFEPLEPVTAYRERYIYDSHDGPNCVIYRREGIPPR